MLFLLQDTLLHTIIKMVKDIHLMSTTTLQHEQHDKYKVLSMLIIFVKDNIIYYIANIDDPIQLWQFLHDLFDNKNVAQMMLLFNQLHSTTMDKTSLVTNFIQKISEITI